MAEFKIAVKDGRNIADDYRRVLERAGLQKNGCKLVEMNDDKWIGIDEAANYLGVNKDSIKYYARGLRLSFKFRRG